MNISSFSAVSHISFIQNPVEETPFQNVKGPNRSVKSLLNHRLPNAEGRSATLGKVLDEASTTICFSWLIYPLKKFL